MDSLLVQFASWLQLSEVLFIFKGRQIFKLTFPLNLGTASQSPMKPIKIYEKLKLICKHLVHGRQEDAHEFLRYILSWTLLL